MKEPARLIIPLWGEVYASKLMSMTLPALLTRGNLPALCESFDVELVIVAETKLFDLIGQSKSFRLVAELCRTKLVPIDDLMTDLPGDYGVVLTYALFRGFIDLGPRMTDTFLLFLNADFIISDGSLRHVAKLMREGKRVIHAPSFRVVLEDVWPKLLAAVDPQTCTLDIEPRAMVKLALEHKHVTVKARTVNQKLCHQIWMDQFYWYVDDETLIGYQWPVALVAIKPERVITEPTLVWDYGFIPEAAPTAAKHFIADSDDFFMLEPQKRTTGEDLVRLGWVSLDEIASRLSKWTTHEQRECGKQLLMFHAGDLPADLDAVAAESRIYMAEIYRRLTPDPQPHIGHGHLGAWFEAAKERMRGKQLGAADGGTPASGAPAAAPESGLARLLRLGNSALGHGYDALFGRPPEVGRHHPLWLDLQAVSAKLAEWQASGKSRVLWLCSGDSFFHRKLENRIDPMSLLVDTEAVKTLGSVQRYDACLCELRADELPSLRELHDRIRPMLGEGCELVVYVYNKDDTVLRANDLAFCDRALPDVDRSAIYFSGSRPASLLRRLYFKASQSFQGNPLARGALTAVVLLSLAPFVWLANTMAARRDPSTYTGAWTSLMLVFTIGRRLPVSATGGPAALGRRSTDASPRTPSASGVA